MNQDPENSQLEDITFPDLPDISITLPVIPDISITLPVIPEEVHVT